MKSKTNIEELLRAALAKQAKRHAWNVDELRNDVFDVFLDYFNVDLGDIKKLLK